MRTVEAVVLLAALGACSREASPQAALRHEPWRSPAVWGRCGQQELDGGARAPLLPQGGSDWSKAIFRLERRSGYGRSPEYRVSLYPDGRIEYDGTEYTGARGRRVARASQADRAPLIAAFQAEFQPAVVGA